MCLLLPCILLAVIQAQILNSTPINKLGTDQWQRAKRKAAEKVRDVAAELLDLYAKRAARPGHRYELT